MVYSQVMASEIQIGRIQRFCLHDGPGIRTVAFTQGCPGRCWWCHNPELQAREGGRAWPVDELVAELLRDRRYWRASGGGITVSGGEPLAQPHALADLLGALGTEGVHRCVETSLGVSPASLEAVIDRVDLWLVDIKHADPAALAEGAGLDLATMRTSLDRLLDGPATAQLRVPLIRGFNTSEKDLAGLQRFLAELPTPRDVKILPGHDLGRDGHPSAAVTTRHCQKAREHLAASGHIVEVQW